MSIEKLHGYFLRPTLCDSRGLSLFTPSAPKSGAVREQRGIVLAILESVDQFNGLTEVAAFDGHDHVNGVEVFLTAEAPGQVGFGVGGGVEP
jgi:hypothetical protein